MKNSLNKGGILKETTTSFFKDISNTINNYTTNNQEILVESNILEVWTLKNASKFGQMAAACADVVVKSKSISIGP